MSALGIHFVNFYVNEQICQIVRSEIYGYFWIQVAYITHKSSNHWLYTQYYERRIIESKLMETL